MRDTSHLLRATGAGGDGDCLDDRNLVPGTPLALSVRRSRAMLGDAIVQSL